MGFLKELIHPEMQVDHPKLKDIFEHEDEWMEYLLTLKDKQLEKKLNIVDIQLKMALEQKKFVEVDLLYLFKQLIIQARVRKNEIECETGIYEQDEEEKPKAKRKPKQEKQAEAQAEQIQESEIVEEEAEEQEEPTPLKQLSLFNSDDE